MYKNNRFFIPDINIKSNKKAKRKQGKNIVISSKLKRTVCFLTGCIHILIFVLIYVFGIKDLYMRNDIEEAVAYMFLGIGFLIAGIFCFRHFKLQDKVNIVTFNIGVLLAAFFTATLVVIWVDEWVNHLDEVDDDIGGSIICIIGILLGVLVALGGLKGGRAREVLDSLDKNNAINNERKNNLNNYVKSFENNPEMKAMYGMGDEKADEDDGYDKDENIIVDENKKNYKHNNMREIIYKTLLNNKPNDNNFR